jgi:alkylation response protein AidB-like acyl-CoA dehydrogenase
MSPAEVKKLYEVNETYFDGISELIAKLGPRFAERAGRADEGDLFVAENFVELKAHGLVAAGVPKELGGGGASHADLADVLRHLGHYCGSCVGFFHAHASGRNRRLALAASKRTV